MTLASTTDFRAAAKVRKYRAFFSPHIDKDIRIQSMTEFERLEIIRKSSEDGHEGEQAARSMMLCVIDDNGKRIFSDDQLPMLLSLPTGLVQHVYDEIDKLCGIKPQTDTDKLKDAKKNSNPTTDDDSPSSSPTA